MTIQIPGKVLWYTYLKNKIQINLNVMNQNNLYV